MIRGGPIMLQNQRPALIGALTCWRQASPGAKVHRTMSSNFYLSLHRSPPRHPTPDAPEQAPSRNWSISSFKLSVRGQAIKSVLRGGSAVVAGGIPIAVALRQFVQTLGRISHQWASPRNRTTRHRIWSRASSRRFRRISKRRPGGFERRRRLEPSAMAASRRWRRRRASPVRPSAAA